MNNNVSTNCFGGCNGENGIIWILILLLLLGGGSCGLNFGNCGNGMDSLIIIIFILFFFSGNNGLF